MTQEFNPLEWYDKAKAEEAVYHDQSCRPSANQSFPPKRINNPSISSNVDMLIARIEAAFTDITTSYADWLNLGFAFASEFGESGRKFYHRVSRFYNGYTKAETDKQYDQCLKSHGHGITIKTFFHLAKQAGIEAKHGAWGMEHGAGDVEHGVCSVPSDAEDDPPEEEQPTLPDHLFDHLPDFFKRVVVRASSKEERDILLLGAMVTVGSCLTNFSGRYDEKTVFPNLFLYITAKASSGKGRLVLCRNLVNLIHQDKRKQFYQENLLYETEVKEYNLLKGKDLDLEKPRKPPVRMLFIPANNSSSGFLQLIADNEGKGLILETEGDTISQALKTDYGNFSDILRKAFHHEFISYYRKTDHEHGEIERPRFAMILSSTFGQLKNLIPSTENGLSSRFMFYNMNLRPVWKDVFVRNNDISLEEHFDKLGQEFYCFYNTLQKNDPIFFRLSNEQQDAFNAFFARMQDKYLVLQGLDYLAIIRRLGLIAFRLMMILTAMRLPETGDFSVKQSCLEEDFEAALEMINVLVRHASFIVSQLPVEAVSERRANKKELFFDALPEKFTYKEFVELAGSLSIQHRTAERYIRTFCEKGLIDRSQQGVYTNPNHCAHGEKEIKIP
jgi:hypothetical protein